MADSTISGLPLKAAPIGADSLEIVDSVGISSKKITIATLPISTSTATALDLKLSLSSSKTYLPNAGSGYNAYLSNQIDINPVANSPLQVYALLTHQINFDTLSSGFDIGVGGQAAQIFNLEFNHQGTSDTGNLTYFNCNNSIGNGIDAIAVGEISFFNGAMTIDANASVNGIQGFAFSPNMAVGSFLTNGISAFSVGSNLQTAVSGFNSFSSSNTILSIKNNVNFSGFTEFSNISTFTGNSSYFGLDISPVLGTFDTGYFYGINLNPNITNVVNANGIYVNMSNVTATGTKYAAFLDGDVNITGSSTFGGALSVGEFSAFASENLVDGGGNPSIIHGLVSSVTAPNGVTTANYDYIGVNTSSIFTAEANSINTAGPLAIGACSLGLPMVITTQTGSVTDVVCGAIFALSMDAGSTGGTITQATGGRSVAIPNGITTIDRHYGWYADCPFGTIATDNWGIYQKDAEHNFFGGNVKIGAGGDTPTVTMALDVGGDTYLAGAVTLGVGGSALINVITGSATLDFPSVGPNSGADLTITITGAIVGNPVHIGVVTGSMSIDDDLTYFGWVSAADTVTVRMLNAGGGTHNPTSQPFKILVTQF